MTVSESLLFLCKLADSSFLTVKTMIRTILPDNQRLREEINCVLDNGKKNHHSPITL